MNDESMGVHLKGIHDTVKVIQKDIEVMRRDLNETKNKVATSAAKSEQASQQPNESQPRKI